VDGFKQKMATKISTGIRVKLKDASLTELMHATNIFGRGFGIKKMEIILSEYPTILEDTNISKQDKIKLISKVQGMAKKTSEQFVEKIEYFISFIKDSNLYYKLNYVPKQSVDKTHPLFNKKYVMTGFRDKELLSKLDNIGAEQASSVSKNTFVLIVKNMDEETGKVDDAKKLNISIMTPEMINNKYF
jgi:NAD-dependent DNA ligase